MHSECNQPRKTLETIIIGINPLMEPKDQSDDEINDTPIEEVRQIVPTTDDPTLPVITFRTWVLGPVTCICLSLFHQITGYRQTPVRLPAQIFQLLYIPIGKLMAAKLPTKPIPVPFTKCSFSMNPGPFNVKEHVVLYILATSGLTSDPMPVLVTVSKAMFHANISFWGAFLLIQTSQMMGYGITGIFMKFLVKNPYMWWPQTLSDVSYYRMLHEVDERPRRKLTRIQFFIIAAVSSFAYYIVPGYFFQSASALSLACWIWKDSITAQQIGSGLHGLGIGSFSLNWSSITTYAGDPLIMPMFTIVNTMIGVILVAYIIGPISYWTNTYGAKRFPLISMNSFDMNGQIYNISRIINDDIILDEQAYNNYSPMYLSIFMILGMGFGFAAQTSTLTHFILFHARETWNQLKQGLKGQSSFNDVHNRLMKKYEPIPLWWFYAIIVLTMVLSLLNSILFGKQFQVPYWMLLLGYLLPFVLILPVGIIRATTGQGTFAMTTFSELIIGLIYPGNPLGNIAFTSYSESTLSNAISFMSEFKLAHYMKIPPKSMFIAQIVSSLLINAVELGVQWWILTNVDNICDPKKLPEGSPWSCPFVHMAFTRIMVWGGIGPSRMFSRHGQYPDIYIFAIIGVVSTLAFWVVMHMFPNNKWIKFIHIPVILGSAAMIPPSAPMHFWALFAIAVFFKYVVYRRHPTWWARYNYLLSAGLEVGATFMVSLATVALNMNDVYGVKWWGLSIEDHCPLASCPISPNVKVDGCPVFD